MKKVEESESSHDEETYQDYFTNPQKRKMYDSQRLYQQQKELQKMSGFNKQIVIEPPKRMKDFDNQRNYATVSLFCLTVTNPFRDKIIKLVLNQWFDRFILLVILTNCVFLAIDDPNVDPLYYQQIADYVFMGIFTVEMCLKIIAMGFAMRPYSYLRDVWNILDFIVVILGWASMMSSATNISAIRVIRILRPLRTINSMPGMRRLVQSLLNSLPTLFDILLLFSFFLIMFGTIATQLFGGLLNFRCVDEDGEIQEGDDENSYFCNSSVECPGNWTCEKVGSPDFNMTSFDNILKSVLNIFIIITLEGWSEIMYKIRNATGTVLYDIFFILVVIFGAFFVLNLMIAVQFSYLNAQFEEDKLKQQPKNENNQIESGAESPQVQGIKVESQNQISQDQASQNDNFSQAVGGSHKENKLGLSLQEQNTNPAEQQNQPRASLKEKKIQKQKCLKLRQLRKKISTLVEGNIFNLVIILLIIVNTLLLAMEHYEMPEKLVLAIQYGNSTLTCIFAVEMVLKIIGLGIVAYIKDGFNNFDAIIVIVGLLEFINAGSKALTVLRAFRLLRIFKIVKSWTTLKKLLQTVLNSFSSIANLGLLMFLLIFIYALIGMQFFSGDMPDNEDGSFRFHFNSFGYSLLTIFVVLTSENWNDVLMPFINKDGFGASFYFVTIIIFGNIMILNLFLAILLNFISDNLEQEDPNKESEAGEGKNPATNEVIEEEFDYVKEKNKIKAEFKGNSMSLRSGQVSPRRKQSVIEIFQIKEDIRIEDISVNIQNEREVKISEKSNEEDSNAEELPQKIIKKVENEEDKSDINQVQIKLNQSVSNIETQQNLNKSLKKTFKKKNSQSVMDIEGKSLFIFSQNSKIRKVLKSFLQHPYFENLIYYLIALNSFILALDEPTQDHFGYENYTLDLCVTIISSIFIFEAICKIIVLGFVRGKNSYLKDPWNILDFIIVVFSIINWVLDSLSDLSVSFLRGFRALRALRPLRMVSKNEGMKIVVNSLLTSIPSLINVMLVSLLFFLVFGILGIQLFKGALGQCNDEDIHFKRDCIGLFYNQENIQINRQWIVPVNNFDNIFRSMMSFFELATLENWPELLFRTIDSVGVDEGPIFDNRPYVSLLLIAFIFVTTFFIMNLFISVIVDKFNEEIKKKEGSHNFSEEQKEWVKMQRIMVHINLKIKPVCPENNKFRSGIFHIVETNKFEFFISIMIVLNTILLCMDYYDAPYTYKKILEIGNIIFVTIFTIEAALKMIGYGFKYYFLENWNRFDFVIVILSLVALDESLFSFKVNALRIIRVARLLRMVKASKGIRHLLKTLWLSLGNIANVGMLLILVFFTFSVAGIDLFGDITKGEYISHDANFSNFYLSMMLLFRTATGEDWCGVMHDCIQAKGVIAAIYWISFQIITFYVFLNVFIAVIYENFNDVKASEDENEVLSLKRKDIKAFVNTWALFCPNGEHYMKTTQFPTFLMKLPPPLGYEGHKIEQSKLNKIIFCLNIKSHLKDNEGKVYFPEVMWAIFHSIIGNNDEQVHKCEQVVNIMKQLKRKYKGIGKNVTPDSLCGNRYYRTEMTVSKYMCALQIYKNWKKFKLQKELNKPIEQLKKEQEESKRNYSFKKKQELQIISESNANILKSLQNSNSPNKFTKNEENKESVSFKRSDSKDSFSEEAKNRSRDEVHIHPNQQQTPPINNNNEPDKHSQILKIVNNNNINQAIQEEGCSFESEDFSEEVDSKRTEKIKYLEEKASGNKQFNFAREKGNGQFQEKQGDKVGE